MSYTYKEYNTRIKSASNKRIIAETKVNGKTAYFLLDTGSSIGVINSTRIKEYDLIEGKKYHGEIVGGGGKLLKVRYCLTNIKLAERMIPQFLLTDITNIVNSIKRETGIEILGIISLPQMKRVGLNIDANSNEFWFE